MDSEGKVDSSDIDDNIKPKESTDDIQPDSAGISQTQQPEGVDETQSGRPVADVPQNSGGDVLGSGNGDLQTNDQESSGGLHEASTENDDGGSNSEGNSNGRPERVSDVSARGTDYHTTYADNLGKGGQRLKPAPILQQ